MVMMGDMAPVSAKMIAYCARFALLFHMIKAVMQAPHVEAAEAVDAESVGCAAQMVRWFSNEAERVYRFNNESKEQQRARELVEVIQAKGGRVTVRELMRCKNRYENAQQARDDLLALGSAGVGMLTSENAGNPGGRPSEVFVLAGEYGGPGLDGMTDDEIGIDKTTDKSGDKTDKTTPAQRLKMAVET